MRKLLFMGVVVLLLSTTSTVAYGTDTTMHFSDKIKENDTFSWKIITYDIDESSYKISNSTVEENDIIELTVVNTPQSYEDPGNWLGYPYIENFDLSISQSSVSLVDGLLPSLILFDTEINSILKKISLIVPLSVTLEDGTQLTYWSYVNNFVRLILGSSFSMYEDSTSFGFTYQGTEMEFRKKDGILEKGSIELNSQLIVIERKGGIFSFLPISNTIWIGLITMSLIVQNRRKIKK